MGKIKTSEIEKLLTRVHRDAEILAVLNFGSTSRQEQTPLSDTDICLILVPHSEPYDPQTLPSKRLEYLKDFSLDVQVFQQLPLYIRKRVLKEGRILFVRDESRLYELAFRTVKNFEDFRHIYYDYLGEVAKGNFKKDESFQKHAGPRIWAD
jgi:predicted nucleotidyltransferase